jgi:hypothetical protein
LQTADDKELVEGIGEAAEKSKYSKPDDGEAENANATEAVCSETGEPTAEGRKKQSRSTEKARLRLVDVPEQDERREHEAVDHDIHAVKHPTREGGDESGAFFGVQM